MRKFSRLAAVMAGLLVMTAGSQVALAGCTNLGSGFPVFQCGYTSWFATPPAGAGNITSAWWQLHYGNRAINSGAGGGTALEGTGNQSPATFNGNDSGNFSIVLTEAASVLPQYASQIPAGALCSNYENSWSQPGVDGCSDNPRTPADDDNKLNPYYDATYGPGYYSTDRLVDYPMGILLTESSNQYFALAFIANRQRGTNQTDRANDISDGDFVLGAISNGDANPVSGLNNVIPWQAIPKQHVDGTTFSNPADKQNSDRILALSWPAVRIVSDQSVRTSGRTLNNPGNGVGVNDQGDIVRYVVEGAPITTANPDPGLLTWSALTTTTGTTASVQVAPDTAIRLRSVFGVVPATSATSAANCRLGLCGDIGYDVVSGLTIIAGPLASEKVVDLSATCRGNKCTISFGTTSENTVSSISVLAVSKRDETVVKTLTPQQGTTGLGATYSVELSKSDLKGAKEIAVRLDGTGGSLISKSATVSIK